MRRSSIPIGTIKGSPEEKEQKEWKKRDQQKKVEDYFQFLDQMRGPRNYQKFRKKNEGEI